ncbi:MAG: pyridoxal phosphate-dependent decarboxylase family protein [Planctomycetota bacterium]|jgi:glutamate/tyrosine decarboxylase-like PLP-dependent enzyme
MEDHPTWETLELSREEMLELGRKVMDAVVDRWAGVREGTLGRTAPRAELERRFREAPPERGADPDDVVRQALEDVLPNTITIDHPRFFAFIPVPSNFVGFLADVLATGFNVFAGTWLAGSGPAEIELVTIDWLRQLCGLPEGAGGLFVSGGSMANLTALSAARHARLGDHDPASRVYFSDQTHSSVERALSVMGFSREQRVRLPSDFEFRLDLGSLEEAVASDRAQGYAPFCVVANAGTTNTGAVDPLAALASYCRKEDLWFHVDGAYGAPAVLCQKGEALLEGIGLADSLTLDPHKWLFQPMEAGCVLLREGNRLRDAFRVTPEYMKDTEGEVNVADAGLQLTRGFRALKLWMSMKTFGVAAFRDAVAHGIRLGELAQEVLESSPRFEIVTPAQLGILTFRLASAHGDPGRADEANRSVVGRLREEGRAMLSTTELRGRTVLRMCVNNPRTTEEDIRETVGLLERWAGEVEDP